LPIVSQVESGHRLAIPAPGPLRDNWQLEMGDGQFFLIMDFDPLFW
jgi:hypothetical protein